MTAALAIIGLASVVIVSAALRMAASADQRMEAAGRDAFQGLHGHAEGLADEGNCERCDGMRRMVASWGPVS